MNGASRWGLSASAIDVPMHAYGDLLRELEDSGYTDIWSGESSGSDAFSPLLLAAAHSSTIHLGTAVVSAFLRGPALLAQSVAGLVAAAPGRVSIGIGSSSDVIVEQWNGLPFQRPYARVRDIIMFLRDSLSGDKVTADYESFRVQGFRLGRPVPEGALPALLVGALRPRMLRLAGTVGDGVVLNWLSVEDLASVLPLVAEGGPGKDAVAYLMVLPVDDAAAARAIARRAIASYLTVPVYAEYHRWLGRGERLQGLWNHWAAGDRRAALECIDDETVDELVIHGSVEACREHIERYVAAGVTTPVIALQPGPYDVLTAVRALAPAARM